MNIKFEGSLTKDEYKSAIKLADRPLLTGIGIRLDLWMVFFVVGLVTFVMGLWILLGDSNLISGIIAAILGAVVFLLGLKYRNALDQAWNEFQKTDTKREGVITNDYLETRSSTYHCQILWEGISGYGEHQNVIVLFQGELAHPFSPRFFQNDSEWQEFKKFVTGKFTLTHKL